ncbi:histone-lysine N-methyltransferase SETMAR [Trichonephila clavipes]|nr:histone-lysine N-methyltransferase SETMAR [Trichonephila clavipes]
MFEWEEVRLILRWSAVLLTLNMEVKRAAFSQQILLFCYLKVEIDGATCHTSKVQVNSKSSQTIKIISHLENWSCLELQAMIRFLWANNKFVSDIHRQIFEIYGEEALRRHHVVKWCRSFQSGRQDVDNRNMAGNGRPSFSTTEINTT